jgi:hypothetical protein
MLEVWGQFINNTRQDDPNVPEEDKHKIRELLHKPWNPYVRRHSSLTQKSGILKEHHLRQFAGWSMSSKMPQKYIHYFGNESSNDLLKASGIIPNDIQQSDALKSKQCPSCSEPNKHDSKFCTKCHIVLTYDSYAETLELENKKDREIANLKEQMQSYWQSFEEFKVENRRIIKEAMAKYTATLSPKALARFRKIVKQLIEKK